MQRVDCSVRIGGDRNHTTKKRGITVAEVEVLRFLHGENAVENIKPIRMTKDQAKDVIDEMKRKYRVKFPGPNSSGAVNVVDVVYPGPRPNLPTNLKDIGVEHPQAAAGHTPAGSKPRGKGGKKAQPAPAPAENTDPAPNTFEDGGEGDDPATADGDGDNAI